MNVDGLLDYALLFYAGGTCIIGSICYNLYKKNLNLIISLKNAPKLEVDEDLPLKLQELSGKSNICPYVALSGYAQSDGNPIAGFYSHSSVGVIRQVEVNEHREYKGKHSELWHSSTRKLVSNLIKEPFSLCNPPGSVRVVVKNPLLAHDLHLDTVFEKYEPASTDLAEKVFDYLSGHKVVGIQTIEKMLIQNTKLTGIGKITLHNGNIYLNQPDGYLKYILTKDSVESLIKSEQSSAFVKKMIAYTFFGISTLIITYCLYKVYKKYKALKQYEKLEIDNRFTSDDSSCIICFNSERNIVLIPCGHVCVCNVCMESLQQRCPMCRKSVEKIIPIYKV